MKNTSPHIIFVYITDQEVVVSRFGDLLIKYRRRARITQKELGKKVGVDDSYISRLERGVYKPPSRDVVDKLIDALGISDKDKIEFLSEAGVLNAEDLEGFELREVVDGEAEEEGKDARRKEPGGGQAAIAGTGVLGSGASLGAILPRSRTGQQQTDSGPQQRDQHIGFLVKQTVDKFQLTPQKRILAERLILENARSVCEVLANELERR